MKTNKTSSLIQNKVDPGLNLSSSVKAYTYCQAYKQQLPSTPSEIIEIKTHHKKLLSDWRKHFYISKRKPFSFKNQLFTSKKS